MMENHNLKGFVFTLDAVFALVVAAVGVSLLLYVHFVPVSAYQAPVQEAAGTLQSLLQSSIAQTCLNVSLGNIQGCSQTSNTATYGSKTYNVPIPYSFGTYNAPSYQSTLQALANLYMNYNTPYASALLSAIYPSNSTAIFVNSIYAPSINLQVASLNGASSYVAGPASAFPYGSNAVSVFAWVQTTNSVRETIFSFGSTSGTGQTSSIDVSESASNGHLYADFYSDSIDSGYVVNDGLWHFVGFALSAGSNTITFAVDSNIFPLQLPTIPTVASGTNYQVGRWPLIGSGDTAGHWFNGQIADVQVYNSKLSTAQISQLYQEGIAGAPIATNVIAWLPLPGNVNDYSVNGYNGVATSVTYSSSLAGNYLPAGLKNAQLVSKATAPLIVNVSGKYNFYNVSVVVWR